MRTRRILCLVLALMMVFNVAWINRGAAKVVAAEELSVLSGSTVVIDAENGLITSVVPKVTALTLKGNFEQTVTIKNLSGSALSDTAYVATGHTVTYNGTDYAIVISGDLNGDGTIGSTDKLFFKANLSSMSNQSTAVKTAADLNRDGACTTADMLLIVNQIANRGDVFASLYGAEFVLNQDVPKYTTADDAVAGTSSGGTASAGTYYIYKGYPNGLNGAYNLTTDSTGATAGFWVSLEDNAEEETSDISYEVVTTINKYSNAVDASNRVNATGTLSAGAYYIYQNYPNGYNGMYNLTTDPTGAAAGYWINPAENVINTAETYVLDADTPKYSTSTDAINMTNSTGVAAAGTYYIYVGYPNGYQGMYNLTTDPTGETAGFWINPTGSSVTTAATYVLTEDLPKYSSATDALAKTNSTGTAVAGTYFIYNGYPDGYQGMYNLTSDPTGEQVGFWINPTQLTVSFINADGSVNLVRNINKYSSSVNAINQTNIAGVIDKDTKYYVYNAYPNGVNGAYNITTDSTGETAGVWVNPIENTAGRLNYSTVKGVWISQYEINSMAVSGSSQANKTTYTNKVIKALTAAKNCGYNTVFVQVRPNGDSFYPSSYYPMSKYVVGAYGLAASYDPFQIIVDQAQELALSVQAWVNPMRLMSTSEIKSVGSTYLIKQWYNSSTYNGTYIVAVDGNYYLNPAYADVRNLIVNGVTEICTKYAVDGIHFDDYFYPTTASSFDSAAFASSGQTNIGNFRRACVNALIRSTYSAVKGVDDDLLFGVSPAGSINNNMYTLYADVKTWVNNTGYIDYIAPQLYWGFEHTQSPFEEVLDEWVTLVGSKDNVDLIIGLDLSMAEGETDSYDGTEWTDHKDVIARQITTSSTRENFKGVITFSMRSFFNCSTGYYTSSITDERANFEPVLKALYITEK